MTLTSLDIYEDVITKLVACVSKTDRKKIKCIKIRYLDKTVGARPEPPDKIAEEIHILPGESKMILTSVKIETEVFKP